MWAIVINDEITKIIVNPARLTIDDVKYSPKIFSLWTVEEKEAKGIYEIVHDNSNRKDEQWYINTNVSYDFDGSEVTSSYGTATPKEHEDITWTQADIDDLDEDEGLEVGDLKTRGLKYNLIKDLKLTVANELAKTDWYITRKTEKSTAIPSAISTHRNSVRTKQATMETQITNASNTPALETLYKYTITDGVQSRPLGELPTLEI